MSVPGALLWIGDVHAQQGDGELSGTAMEIGADVEVRVDIVKDLALRWPWVETHDRLMSISASLDFAEARREAVESMMLALEHQLGLDPPKRWLDLGGGRPAHRPGVWRNGDDVATRDAVFAGLRPE